MTKQIFPGTFRFQIRRMRIVGKLGPLQVPRLLMDAASQLQISNITQPRMRSQIFLQGRRLTGMGQLLSQPQSGKFIVLRSNKNAI